MADAKICDRCRCYYQPEVDERAAVRLDLHKTIRKSFISSKESKMDLCEACERELKEWFDYRAGGSSGYWFDRQVYEDGELAYALHVCSECSYAADQETPFCPSCGAAMKRMSNES